MHEEACGIRLHRQNARDEYDDRQRVDEQVAPAFDIARDVNEIGDALLRRQAGIAEDVFAQQQLQRILGQRKRCPQYAAESSGASPAERTSG